MAFGGIRFDGNGYEVGGRVEINHVHPVIEKIRLPVRRRYRREPRDGHRSKTGKPFVRSWQLQPLAIARLAAMTPPDWQANFFDDRMDVIDFNATTDLVAISIETYSAKRGYHIAAQFRKRGIPGGDRRIPCDAMSR